MSPWLSARRVIDSTPSDRLLFSARSGADFWCFLSASLFNLQGTRSNCGTFATIHIASRFVNTFFKFFSILCKIQKTAGETPPARAKCTAAPRFSRFPRRESCPPQDRAPIGGLHSLTQNPAGRKCSIRCFFHSCQVCGTVLYSLL